MPCSFCKTELIPEPVPGAAHYPRRLVCPLHGYPRENPKSWIAGTETEKPNDYLTEVASPADLIVNDEWEIVDSLF